MNPAGNGASLARVAGADTREAQAAPAVRAAAAAVAFVAGPAWAAALGVPAAWKRYLEMPTALGPWVAVTLVIGGLCTAVVARRVAPRERAHVVGQLQMPRGLGPALILIVIAFVAVGTGDPKLAATVLPAVPLVAGWFAGQAVRRATEACDDHNSSAAAGLVVAGGLIGLLGAGHLALVAKGSGIIRATGWSIAYLAAGSINMIRAHRLPGSRSLAVIEEPTPDIAPAGRGGTRHKPPAEPVFILDRVSVAFGGNRVLRGASLRVAPGELVALVGGNGAGKSTLMRVAAGLTVPDAGRVTIRGDDVTTLLVEERAAAGLAFVSGARPIFPDLTVLENLRVAAFRSHLTPRSFMEATSTIFEVMPAIARRPKARAGVLSGGEQRLLAVAQTLYRRPAVLLADELSLGLDAQARLAVLELLRVLADEGVAVIAVDHDLITLLPRSDRAALLAEGVITTHEHPERLLTRRSDLLPATFLSSAGR